MAGKMEKMKEIKAKRDRIAAEIEALQNRLKGWDDAIAAFESDGQQVVKQPELKTRGKNVKETVLSLVESAGDDGLTVSALMDKAKESGIHLDRGSVSSLLSRMKREKVFGMIDGKYFIPKASQTTAH